MRLQQGLMTALFVAISTVVVVSAATAQETPAAIFSDGALIHPVYQSTSYHYHLLSDVE